MEKTSKYGIIINEMNFQIKGIKIIIGLGNPGKNYEKTYHNIGLIFLDYLAAKKEKSSSPILVKSETFMNESGGGVKKILKKSKIKPEETLIIHDDSDLKIGDYKLSFDRGAGDHNGIASIIKSLGTKKFWRLRIGIRENNETKRVKAGEMVLKKIKPADNKKLENLFSEITLLF